MSLRSIDTQAPAQLLAIVCVQYADRVRCAQPNCGHSVYRQIHVVEDNGTILVLGSTCFGKRYGGFSALGEPRYGGTGGRQLTDAERQLLTGNTAALLAQFEYERTEAEAAALAAEAARQADSEARYQATFGKQRVLAAPAPMRSVAPTSFRGQSLPWPWMKPHTALTYFEMKDKTSWMRVTHFDGTHLLVPWPMFDTWDESLPVHVGFPHATIDALVLPNLIQAVAYLRPNTTWEKMCGLWRDMAAELIKRRAD